MTFHRKRIGLAVWVGLLVALLWTGQVVAGSLVQVISSNLDDVEIELTLDGEEDPLAVLPTVGLTLILSTLHASSPVAPLDYPSGLRPGHHSSIRAPPRPTSA